MTDLRFDLKLPCADCPFTPRAELNGGVGKQFVTELFWRIERGIAGFTCHKTDPRADGGKDAAQKTRRELQHCAGFLLMMERENNRQVIAERAVEDGIFHPERLNSKARVFTRLGMLNVYERWFKARMPKGKTGEDYVLDKEAD